jgi:hypothetical protein
VWNLKSVAQCHIADAVVMTATAVIGVGLCAMSEFDPERVRQALGIDIPKFEIGLQLLLVCRAQSQPRLNCLPLFQLVEYR